MIIGRLLKKTNEQIAKGREKKRFLTIKKI